jgi:uncharacterized repeat protein (TIGR01451 family)
MVENFLYIGLPYIPTDYDAPEFSEEILLDTLETELGEIGGSPQGESVAGETSEAVSTFLDEYTQYIEYSGTTRNFDTTTYFLRSEYAENEGIEIRQSYTDTTPPHLQTGDRVYYDISFTNVSGEQKNNIAYVDSIPEYFRLV